MKGYEDVASGLALLVIVLVGGYFYLNSEVFEQTKHQAVKKVVVDKPRQRCDEFMFECMVKRTE